MKEIIKIKEVKNYEFDENEKKQIIRRVLNKNKFNLNFYWDYNDNLSEEQIYTIITEEDGLNEVENDIYLSNYDYISEQIDEMINESLSDEEKTDEDLREELFDVLRDNYDLDLKSLIKMSSARFRIELNTNEDYLYVQDYKNTQYWKDILRIFKESITEKEFEEELFENVGSDYVKLTFFFKVGGNNILNLRREYQKGKITLNTNIKGGFFNSDMGCGSILELQNKKPITLNLKNWIKRKGQTKYDDIILYLDSEGYGIQKTCGLVGEEWKEY